MSYNQKYVGSLKIVNFKKVFFKLNITFPQELAK